VGLLVAQQVMAGYRYHLVGTEKAFDSVRRIWAWATFDADPPAT
jgi:hypothetical protein